MISTSNVKIRTWFHDIATALLSWAWYGRSIGSLSRRARQPGRCHYLRESLRQVVEVCRQTGSIVRERLLIEPRVFVAWITAGSIRLLFAQGRPSCLSPGWHRADRGCRAGGMVIIRIRFASVHTESRRLLVACVRLRPCLYSLTRYNILCLPWMIGFYLKAHSPKGKTRLSAVSSLLTKPTVLPAYPSVQVPIMYRLF